MNLENFLILYLSPGGNLFLKDLKFYFKDVKKEEIEYYLPDFYIYDEFLEGWKGIELKGIKDFEKNYSH